MLNFHENHKAPKDQIKTKEKTFQQGELEKLIEHFWQ
jgi:hypothetical protein